MSKILEIIRIIIDRTEFLVARKQNDEIEKTNKKITHGKTNTFADISVSSKLLTGIDDLKEKRLKQIMPVKEPLY